MRVRKPLQEPRFRDALYWYDSILCIACRIQHCLMFCLHSQLWWCRLLRITLCIDRFTMFALLHVSMLTYYLRVCVLICSPMCHITNVNTVAFSSIACTIDAVSLPVFLLSLPCIVCCCPPLQSPASPFQVCSNPHHLPRCPLPSFFYAQPVLSESSRFSFSLAVGVLTHGLEWWTAFLLYCNLRDAWSHFMGALMAVFY